MDITITPKKLSGPITPPPSKSQAHRLIITACLGAGVSRISNLKFSQDIRATLFCMEQLGARWEQTGGDTIQIAGIGAGKSKSDSRLPRFDCGESGSTLRFLIPIALAVAGGGVFTGRGRLMERPQQPYFDLFDEKGIFYEQRDGVLTVRGELTPGDYALPGNVSSQFFTGLLCALPLLDGPSRIYPTTALESWDYIAMTMDALMGAGVVVTEPHGESGCFHVSPQAYSPIDRAVEADWSQAGFYYAANGLGNSVKILGMNAGSVQGDKIICPYYARLCGGGPVELDVSQCPDLVPPLALHAALRAGESTRLVGAARLRIKESDRLATVTSELRRLGADIEEGPDFLSIRGIAALTRGDTASHNDHRIAMMLAMAATRTSGSVTIRDAGAVAKSYPDFWSDYARLGGVFTRTE